jgi:hypothetical protein
MKESAKKKSKTKPLRIALTRIVPSPQAEKTVEASIKVAWEAGALTPDREYAVWSGIVQVAAAVMTESELGEFARLLEQKRGEIAAGKRGNR